MRTLIFVGLAVAIAAIPVDADARNDSTHAARAGRPHIVVVPRMRPASDRWGGKRDGRWHGGWGAPGGWQAYRRPARGFVVHRYWIAPRFHIGNFGVYGFRQPYPGTAWSRYYDDAVMIDGRGIVYDSVHGVDWDRYDGDRADRYDDDDDFDDDRRYGAETGERYDDRDGRRYERDDDGAGGALLGGAVGAIAGNRIAGRGNRTEGTIIGAGVGAVAGAIIDREEDRRRNHPDYEPYPYGDVDFEAGEYDNPYARIAHDGHDAPHPETYHGKHLRGGAHYAVPVPRLSYDHGAFAYAPMVTTVTIHPAVTTTTTTTTTFVEEIAHAPKRWKAKPARRWKAKPHCNCK